MDIAGWLRSLGLERYEAAFRENEIDEKVLPSLTAASSIALLYDATGDAPGLVAGEQLGRCSASQ
jgi:SAM domain (Sterile alpha motif)